MDGSPPTDRRRLLAGSAGLLAALAGCTTTTTTDTPGGDDTASPTDSPTQSPTPDLPTPLVRADGTVRVDYAAATGGEVAVERDRLFEFTDPDETTWELLALHEGEQVSTPAASDALRVTPAVGTDDVPRAWVVPVYDDGFEYHVYANARFVTEHDWQVSAGTGSFADGEEGVGSRAADFTELAAGVHRDVVTADLVAAADTSAHLSVLVGTYTIEELQTTPTPEQSGFTAVALINRDQYDERPRAPQVAFAFEYDADAETVTIAHEGGDTVQGENLTVEVAGVPSETQFSGEVSAGDRVTVDVSGAQSGDPVRVVWSGEDSRVALALFRLP